VAVLGALALVMLVVAGSPAAAHTELVQGSPAPTQNVGGTVEAIDLAFLDVVSEAVVVVTRDGVEVPGAMTVDEGRIVHFQFDEPLTTAGRYDVTYTITASNDGDRMESSYFFGYDPAGPPPQRIGTLPAHDDGPGTVTLVAAWALAAVALAGAVVLARNWLKLRRHRSATSAGVDDRYP
jgi:methionine-rich copper-binding protein CopC